MKQPFGATIPVRILAAFQQLTRVVPACGILGVLAFGTDRADAFQWYNGCCGGKSTPPAYPVGSPMPVGSTIPVNPITPSNGTMSSYYGSYGQYPPSMGTILPAGIPQTVVAAMPTAGYDTQWLRTPVTYYRPVTQYDPNYGTTVTSLQPCASYQYQAQRVPLTAPAPISPNTYTANRYPAINAPGYYPTGLYGSVPATASYPPVQQLPVGGMPVGGVVPVGGSAALAGNTASSSGPASTLPLRTMNYGSSYGSYPTTSLPANSYPIPAAGIANPVVPNQGVANAVYMAPTYNSAAVSPTIVGSTIAGTGTPMYTAPNNALNCINGVCPTYPQGVSSAMDPNVPNIPGALSVTPIGPPTYQSAPSSLPATTLGSTSISSPSTGYGFGASGNGTTSQVLPNAGEINPVLPPGAANDPDAMRQPTLNPPTWNAPSSESKASLGNSNDQFVSKMAPLKKIPIVEIDRTPAMTSGAGSSATSIGAPVTPYGSPTPGSSYGSVPPSINPFSNDAHNATSLKIPSAPALPGTALSPLRASADSDLAPRWNPKLLPRSNGTDTDAFVPNASVPSTGLPSTTAPNTTTPSGVEPADNDSGMKTVSYRRPISTSFDHFHMQRSR
ncbi:MAG: hypothetical protein FJ308_05190 [Planctomycetes bacterium]|nr:hypothetical protein [Planctomycetota bacterium]